jgi:YD repeat-containing protein
MPKTFEFCLPTTGTKVPGGWLHEIKYDGFGTLVQRDGDRVRLITRCTLGGTLERNDMSLPKSHRLTHGFRDNLPS